jgi:hypothetical protein
MRRVLRHRLLRLLPTLLLAALLGAQTAQAAHLHIDHQGGTDCLQCQSDMGHAVLPVTGHATVANWAAVNQQPAIALAPVSTCYRLAARGPPAYSC